MKKQMKNIFFFGILSLMIGLVSCEDYLDREPATEIDPEAAYKNFYNFQGFTEELYHCIPDFAKHEYNNTWNWGEEEYYSPNGRNDLLGRLDRGDFWKIFSMGTSADNWLYDSGADSYSFDTNGSRWNHYLWQGCWYGIRKANMGLENLNKMTGTQEEKNMIAGQLYFFRGWFHFQLIKLWGGLPYIDRLLPAGEKLTLPRLTYQECADKIAEDLKKSAELLPVDWDKTVTGAATSGNNQLRINKIMALSYLGKNYLYAGSPLMNKASGGSESYNAEYCKKSAEAFGEVLKLVESGQTQYALVDFAHYSEIWMTKGQNFLMPGSTEAIFRGPSYVLSSSQDGGSSLSLNKQYLCARVLADRSWSFYPTANYANYFGMANGLPINENYESAVADPQSGYDPQYPWKNRDPRFYITYAFDTKLMIKGDPGSANEKYRYANLYSYGGPSDNGSYRLPETGSPTGYLLLKFNPVGNNKFDNDNQQQHIHIPWLRLADVYLMYAEAVANGYGAPAQSSTIYNALTALDAVNKIRERAGVSPVAAKYSGNTDDFMKELRRERAVELAWEGQRFCDLRRWLLLDKYPYTLKTGIEFDRAEPVNFNKSNPENNKVLNLRDVVVLERKYTEKHYWFPLVKVDASMYLEFPQNPGW
jgi:hypothetical protein